MKITVTGPYGSGQTTLATLLAEKLGYTHKSAGKVFRKFGTTHGSNLRQLEQKSSSNETFDLHTDEETRIFGEKNDNFVYEGRLVWRAIPDAFKILIGCEFHIRAWRYSQSQGCTVREAERFLMEVEPGLKKRFWRRYEVPDWADPVNFDLVLDSSRTSAEELAKQAIGAIKQRHILQKA